MLRDTDPSASVAFARETVERLEHVVGKHDPEYGLGLSRLAGSMAVDRDAKGAIAISQQALGVFRKTLPPAHSISNDEHLNLARYLVQAGRFERGYREISKVAALADNDPHLEGERSDISGIQANAAFELGHFAEARTLLARAVEEAIASYGMTHPTTTRMRLDQLDRLLELGDLDGAAGIAQTLEAAFRSDASRRLDRPRFELEVAMLDGARGRVAEAERRARTALDMWTELGGDLGSSVDMHRGLGRALLANGKPERARAELEQALDIARRVHARADHGAIIEVDLARCDAALGRHAAAMARARAARSVLEHYPARIIARRDADRLLATAKRHERHQRRPRHHRRGTR